MVKKIVWILNLLLYEGTLLYLLLSNKVTLFLNPNMNKYLLFGVLIILLIIVVEIYDIYKKRYYHKIGLSLVVFIIPMILILSYSVEDKEANTLTNSDNTVKEVKKSVFEGMSEEKEAQYFLRFLNEAYNDLSSNDFKKYRGKEVEASGMVYYSDGLKDNEIIVARLLMTCCAADASYVGFRAEYNGDEILQEGDWVRVKGVMSTVKQFNRALKKEEEVPQIIIKELERMDEPKSKFIYP